MFPYGKATYNSVFKEFFAEMSSNELRTSTKYIRCRSMLNGSMQMSQLGY